MLRFNRPKISSVRVELASAALICATVFNAAPVCADAVAFSFATVGDSRQEPVKLNASGNPTGPDPTSLPLSVQDAHWLQNTKAFSRIMRHIQEQKANLLFFNGDMIMGYGKAVAPTPADTSKGLTIKDVVNSDLMQFYTQYAFWRGMVAPLMETGTYVVPVPGNHEVQWKKGGKIAQVENENAWRNNMGDLILDGTRMKNLLGQAPQNFDVANNPSADPATATADKIATDQKQLSYSFDLGADNSKSHFVVINTDPVGNDSHAPVAWLQKDLKAAQANGAKHIFIFGHKPAYFYDYSGKGVGTSTGLFTDAKGQADFWNLVEQYNATYFCGHEHVFNLAQPTAAAGGKAWQVLVGSGGSPFEAAQADLNNKLTANPATDRTYAWATVKVFKNGKVRLDAYGFSDTFGSTHSLLKKSISLP